MEVMIKIIIALYVITTSLALIMLKLSANEGAPVSFVGGSLKFIPSAQLFVAVLLYGISFILYTFLISKYDLGYIIPLGTGLVYIVIFIASYIVFKESFTVIKVIGISFVFLGIYLLNLKQGA